MMRQQDSAGAPPRARTLRAAHGRQAAAWLAFSCGVALSACGGGDRVDTVAAKPSAVRHAATDPLDFTPPPDSAIPHDELGASVRRGLALVLRTTDSLPAYATGSMQCASCHLDAGRRRDAAALIGVYARFPKYMDRTGAVIPIADRVNYCFTRSLAGNRLPTDSREMQDIVAYLAFLSTGVPIGAHVKGQSMPKMPKLTGDTTRGAAIFATTCAVCHGKEGQGTPPLIPALWGPASYSIGASMAREERSATFIRHFMPLSNPGSLTDQQAYDVASFVVSHPRPDSPGKENDWPAGGAPYDVPYNTKGHVAYRPPVMLLPRRTPAGAVVQPPQSIVRRAARAAASGAGTGTR
ncbi:MAG: c-type cytochrome [bacterium]